MQEDNTLMENNDKKSNENNGEIKMSIKILLITYINIFQLRGFL